jgi:Fe-S-cluster-containing hydrogenase component 2
MTFTFFMTSTPYQSLQMGQWVKLICGASYQDMPTISYLVTVYALAGVDCIDVAADPAVVAAAQQGMQRAEQIYAHWKTDGSNMAKPWVMISLNDSEDPHFRKATLNPLRCPTDCPKPCIQACPTDAISLSQLDSVGVEAKLCYGCGRCLPVCPVNNIVTQSYRVRPATLEPSTIAIIDAVEIHTHVGQQAAFQHLWQQLVPWRNQLKLVSISCPDGDGLIDYLKDLYSIISPLAIPILWQTDGRPMSGDLGRGTTHTTIRLARKVLAADIPGFVQLAGGTNHYTVQKLRQLGIVASTTQAASADAMDGKLLPQTPQFAGVAYGSYARRLIMPYLKGLDQLFHGTPASPEHLRQSVKTLATRPPYAQHQSSTAHPQTLSDLFWQAFLEARQLVSQLKYR